MTKRRRFSDFEVGYAKPPASTQFKKGESGNRSGRPKGSKNFRTLLVEALHKEVTVTENGSRRRITKLELGFDNLADQFATGNPRAIAIVFQKGGIAQESDGGEPSDVLDEDDEKVAQAIVTRAHKPPPGTDDDD